MSTASNWSYTSKATHWKLLVTDDWSGQKMYGPPVVFDCDYQAKSMRMTDTNGIEFTSRQIIYTERSSITQGDMVLIGEHTADAIAAKAFEVRAVTRYADTFENLADDYEVAT